MYEQFEKNGDNLYTNKSKFNEFISEIQSGLDANCKRIFEQFAEGKTYAEIEDCDPNVLESLYSIAYHCFEIGDFKSAEQSLEMLTFIDHRNLRYRLALGGVRYAMKKYLVAITDYALAQFLDLESIIAAYWMYKTSLVVEEIDHEMTIQAARSVMTLCENKGKKNLSGTEKIFYREVKIFLRKNNISTDLEEDLNVS